MKILKFLAVLMLVPSLCFGSVSRDWNGTTDDLQNNTSETIPTTVSYLAHYYADTGGEGGFGRIAVYDNTGTGAAPTSGLAVDGLGSCTGTQLRLTTRSDWSTSDGAWTTACTTQTIDVWYSAGSTYDGASSTNDPVLYINGSVATTATDANGTGTLVTAANEIFIGNVDDGTRTFDGQINYVQIWNRILTAVEMAEAHYKPGIIANGLIHFYTIWGDSSEVDHGTGGNDMTVSGTTTSSSGSPHVFFGGGLPL